MRALTVRPGGLSVTTLGLFVALVYAVAVGLAGVVAGVEESLFVGVAILGALLGLAMASLRITGRRFLLLSSLLGVAVVLLRVGGLGPQLIAVFHWADAYLASLKSVWYRPAYEPIAADRLLHAAAELWAALSVLLVRTGAWIVKWFKGTPTFDPVGAALFWTVLLWSAATWAGWMFLSRKQPLAAFVPLVVLLGAGLGSIGAKPGALLWFLGLLIPILTLMAHDLREGRWKRLGIAMSRKVRQGLIVWSVGLSLLLVLAGHLSQALDYREVIRILEELSAPRSASAPLAQQALGLDQLEPAETGLRANLDEVRAPGLPRRHLIQSGPELSERLALLVRVREEVETPGLEVGGAISRYYWRSITYDTYDGRGWTTSPTEYIEYEAGQRIREEVPPGSRLARQTIRSVPALGGLVYAAGSLVTVDQPFATEWRSPEDDFGAVFVETPATTRVESLVPEVGLDELRNSGTDYPAWITSRYLDLPDELPDRVVELARKLTATAPTPFDRAVAIETYLRQYEYTLDVEIPPDGRDVVDYFLFDLKRGYCDYYASAMVVLARAAGLPARLVIGYHTGAYNDQMVAYLVTEADAHSWPEIYFPGYGWIEFEPTAGRPAVIRNETLPFAPALDIGSRPGLSRVPFGLAKLIGSAGTVLLGALLALVAGVSAWAIWARLRVWRLSPEAAVAGMFRQLQMHGMALRLYEHAGMTPYELSASFTGAFGARERKMVTGRILDPIHDEVGQLIQAYTHASYSNHRLTRNDQAELVHLWSRLRWRLWWARLAGRFRRSEPQIP